jgi:phage-related protein
MGIMATGNRTLKLSILADVDDLKKKLNDADNDVNQSASNIEKFGKAAGAAFAVAAVAAAGYAVKIGIDGVKAAIEDEQAQLRLASALKSATGATDAQIKATEDFISKTQLAAGVSDTDLRGAMQRLAVSTKDTTKAQQLLTLALDVSKGTGKDLSEVSEALAKAYEGQDTKLARLGIGLSAADLKTMNFTQTTEKLSELYGGAAARNAETFQGRLDRLKQAVDEGKESIGNALLPYIEKLVDIVVNQVVPALGKFASYFDPIKKAIMDNKETFQDLGNFISTYLIPILVDGLGGALKVIGVIAGGIINIVADVVNAVENAVKGAVAAINAVINAYNSIPLLPNVPTIGGGSAISTASSATATASANASNATDAQLAAAAARAGTTVNNITVKAVDAEGASRTVAKVLAASSARSVPALSGKSVRGD